MGRRKDGGSSPPYAGGDTVASGLAVAALALLVGFISLPFISLLLWTVNENSWRAMASPVARDALLLSIKGIARGLKATIVGNDKVPEFEAQTLPPGSAPADRTFRPNPVGEVPPQANMMEDADITSEQFDPSRTPCVTRTGVGSMTCFGLCSLSTMRRFAMSPTTSHPYVFPRDVLTCLTALSRLFWSRLSRRAPPVL